MARYVIDASVGVEYVLQTRLGRLVSNVMTDNETVAPELFDLEILSALRGLVIRRAITRSAALIAIHRLERWDIQRTSHSNLLRSTWEYHQNVSAYDAIYLAIAKDLRIDLITADSKLTRAPGIDVEVHDVRISNVLAQLEAR